MNKMIITLCLMAMTVIGLNAQPRPTRDDLMSGTKNTEAILDKPFIFTKGELQVGGKDANDKKAFQTAIEKSDAVIAEYQAEVTKFLATNPSPYVFKNKLNSVIVKAKSLDFDIPKTAEEFKSGRSLGGVYYLQKLYLQRGFLEGVTRIFPDSQLLKDYLKSANEAINLYGSREKFMSKMEENYKDYVKNLKMIPAAMSNPKIEAMVKSRFENIEKGYKVTKVNITYPQWRIEKNDLGIPLNRKLSVSIGVKSASGECGIAGANVMEEYQGGGNYGEAFMYLPSNVIIVPCENLK